MKKLCEKYYCKLGIVIILLTAGSAYAQDADSSGTVQIKDTTVYAEVIDTSTYPPNSFSVIPALNFKDTDLRDLLRGIAMEYKTNIVVDNKINDRVSIAQFEITVFNTIKNLAEDNGYEFAYDSRRFFVKTRKPGPEPDLPDPDPVVNYYDKIDKIDMYARDVRIEKFTDALREETGKNFLLTTGSSGRVTGQLSRIDFFTGMQNLLQNNGFYVMLKDSIYYISRSAYFSTIGDPETTQDKHYWVSAQNGNVTVDVKDVPLDRILDDITNQLNLSVIKLASPNNKITVKCTNVPVDQTFTYLFKGTDFTFKNEMGTYIIGDVGKKYMDNIRMIRLNHLRADKVQEKLPQELFEGVTTEVSTEHNALLASGPNQNIVLLEEYLATIDMPVPQVMIEALVVDYNLDELFEFGITASVGDSSMGNHVDQWNPGLDVTASGPRINSLLKDIGTIALFGQEFNVGNLGNLPNDFYINIRALEKDGIANIKSRPLLSTLNGHTAYLKIGTVQNYVFTDIMPIQNQLSSTYIEQERIQKIEAVISFEITPWVGPNDQLTLEIKPEFQTPVGEFSPDKNLIPSINTRTLESTVKLKDGETIVLGGLIQDIESNTVSKFPLLGDIPLLGELFTNRKSQKTKSEMMIYITPRIFYEDEFGYAYYDYNEE